MNLTKRQRALVETALECLVGCAAAVPVVLATTGTSQTVGAGAVVLAVSVFVTNLVQVPAVERFLDRFLGSGSAMQLVTLEKQIEGVSSALEAHALLPHTAAAPSATPSSEGGAAAPESAAAPAASGSDASQASVAGSTQLAAPDSAP